MPALPTILLLAATLLASATLPAENTPQETLRECRQRLASPDAGIRRDAVLVVGKYDLPEVPALLAERLSDEDAGVRHCALVALSEKPAWLRENASAVLGLLRDPEVQNRRLASSLLAPCLGVFVSGRVHLAPSARISAGASADPALLENALVDSDEQVRANVLKALPYYGGRLAFDAVAPFLAADQPRELQALAIPLAVRASCNAPRRRLQALAPFAKSPAAEIRALLATVLWECPGAAELLQTLSRDSDPRVRVAALLSRAKTAAPQEVEALSSEIAAALKEEGVSDDDFSRLLDALWGLSPDAWWNALQTLLPDESLPLPFQAELWTQAVRHRGHTDGLSPNLVTRAFLRLEGNRRARQVLFSLLRQRAPRLTAEELALLQASPRSGCRQAALDLVRQLPEALRAPVLEEALLDEDLSLRKRALELLPVIHPDGWEELLLATLDDPDPTLQNTAAKGLLRSRRKDPEFRDALQRWLSKCTDDSLSEQIQARLW